MTTGRWRRAATAALVVGSAVVFGPSVSGPLAPAAASPSGPAATAAAGPAARADVTGDGIPDIVVASTARKSGGFTDPSAPDETGGSVYVIPGGSTVPGAPVSLIDQGDSVVVGSPEADDNFGMQIVTGDFNGDRRADVAIGNPAESIGTKLNAGAVTVLYGQPTAPYLGLIPNGTNWITQDTGNLPGSVEAKDYFGAALTTGDFNGDGYADLAIGAPGEAIGKVGSAGAVWVLYGGSYGLRTDNAVAYNESSAAIPGVEEKNDHFGSSLAAGDITGDGRDDLVINVAGETVSGTTGAAGCLVLLKGSASGVTTSGVTNVCVPQINIGGHINTVAVGRFHGGSNADVVLYADQAKGAPTSSGALVVLRGSSGGISANNLMMITQNSPGVSDVAEAGDLFGAALSVGDINGDGADDLAVGAPGEDTGAGANEGAVQVFLGGPSGLTSGLDLFLTENHPMINATGQFSEGFGSAVRLLDVTNDGKPELLVTAPFEDFSYNTGTMFVLDLQATSSSITLTGCTTLTRDALGTVSAYGPGAPIAGGVIPPENLPNVT
ncbi:FG-GAP repeat protein [Rhizomonospora bruguierae]|uniref:FG-GAP repeat protein n=1 Tax=Rhizomonospora bruguierae TaxID=1581705 RepID=UPI001BCFB0F1|nr:FG-GAP repeat protein [Micromonospora sp. NBRC 107566]